MSEIAEPEVSATSTETDHATTIQVTVRGLTVPGSNHFVRGQEGQDAWRQNQNTNVAVIAVADGAGSRPCAAEGAALAASISVRAVTKELEDGLPGTAQAWREMLVSVVLNTRRRLADVADLLERASGDLASTLILCVITMEWCAALRVGDGFVAVETPPAELNGAAFALLLPPPEPTKIPGPTVFLTSEVLPELLTTVSEQLGAHVACNVVPTDRITAVVLGTDGIAGAAVGSGDDEGPHAHSGFLGPMVETVRNKRGYELIDVLANGLHSLGGDDKTLVVALINQNGPAESGR